jgi:hypothetical protein
LAVQLRRQLRLLVRVDGHDCPSLVSDGPSD